MISSLSGLLTSVSELFLTLGKRHFTQDGRSLSLSSSTAFPSSSSLFSLSLLRGIWRSQKILDFSQVLVGERFSYLSLLIQCLCRHREIKNKKYAKKSFLLESSPVRKFVVKVGQKLVHGAPKMHNLLAIKVNVK